MNVEKIIDEINKGMEENIKKADALPERIHSVAEKMKSGEVSLHEGFHIMAEIQGEIGSLSNMVHGLFNMIVIVMKNEKELSEIIKGILKQIPDEGEKNNLKEKLAELEKHRPNLDWLARRLKDEGKISSV